LEFRLNSSASAYAATRKLVTSDKAVAGFGLLDVAVNNAGTEG
jgi:hypothetical protein